MWQKRFLTKYWMSYSKHTILLKFTNTILSTIKF